MQKLVCLEFFDVLSPRPLSIILIMTIVSETAALNSIECELNFSKQDPIVSLRIKEILKYWEVIHPRALYCFERT